MSANVKQDIKSRKNRHKKLFAAVENSLSSFIYKNSCNRLHCPQKVFTLFSAFFMRFIKIMSRSEITPEAFIEAMLVHVPFDGWTEAAMQTTADQLGLSASQMAQLFPQGITGLVEIGSDDIDRHMAEIFLNRFPDNFDNMPVHRKIRELLLIRFELLQPNKEAVRKMVAFLAQPAQAKLGSKLLYKTLDRVWRIAGDRSTDYNFYTKRATLGAVYGSTMLAFLDDDTADMQKTRAFLDRRLQDVARVPKAAKPLKVAFSSVGRMLKGAVSMRRDTGGR